MTRVLDAYRAYNSLMTRVNKQDVSQYERERICRVQRRVARTWERLDPSPNSSDVYTQAMEQSPSMTEYDHVPLDNSMLSNTIRAGETFVDLLSSLKPEHLDTDFKVRMGNCFQENGEAFDNVVGFTCNRMVPDYFPAAH